ncbi:Protein kinase domain [Macleaya cordata]|uniref:Protein kinase domain n=1 Tax=Macleaya cordata TaxID=56857 RepID=A0A200QVU1_MACCD|nr:Protein kinase domain [Macleaya cordata]
MAGNCLISSANVREWVKGCAVGAGSFGIVNLAMNKFTGELFAVKSALSGPGLQSLENEADILEDLDSPFVIQCLGREFSNESNGEQRLNLFMEFMAGGSLSDVAEKFGGALDESVIRLYTREILEGLKYVHKNSIVHGDLKCKNLLVGSSGNIKLADFGCSKRISSSKNDAGSKFSWQSICGTPLWTSPEVLRNEGLSFASDIWSLGCTIIEMATGRPPWGDKISNPMAAVFKIACSNEVPQFPTKFSNEGLDFLAKCFQRDPTKRWTSAELLNHPFVLRNLRKEDVNSPVSILDVGLYESDYDDSDELAKVIEEKHRSKFPSLKRQRSRKGRKCRDNDWASSENWITVRSG